MLPVSITGMDFARDNEFYFTLFPNTTDFIENMKHWSTADGALLRNIMTLIDIPVLLYISNMAQRVDPPAETIDMGNNVRLPSLDIPFPKGYNLPQFTVDYLDDQLNLVWIYHKGWQNQIRSGLSLRNLYNLSLSCIYGSAKRAQFGVNRDLGQQGIQMDLPTNACHYRHIFPINIKKTAFDRQSNDFSKVSVTYLRLPHLIDRSQQSKLLNALDEVNGWLK